MNVLLLASHAVAEYDDIRMFSDMGYDVFAPGGYEVPSRSGEGIRPALPDAPHHPEFVALCNAVRAERGEPGPYIDWAKAAIPDAIIEWADVVIVHHFPEVWIGEQWDRLRPKRVIWRTCGQSDPRLERAMTRYVDDGLQVVRYSPAEARFFGEAGAFAGQHALIRFGKYPDDYGPWVGDDPVVGNVTQDMVDRGDSCGLSFYRAATEGLAAKPAGPGSEALPGGIGALSYDDMLAYLRHIRVYLYTGTTPASYTLGLIEAMLSGVPVVSIGPRYWTGPAGLFEANEILEDYLPNSDADFARAVLRDFLKDPILAAADSKRMRQRAIELFDVATVGQQWREFLA